MVDPAPYSLTTGAPASEHDRERIIAVIEGESAAWLEGDIEKWKTFWVQSPRAQHINASPFFGAITLYGFEEIERYFTPMFARIVEERREERDLRHANWRITIGANIAWATFEQILPVDRDTTIGSGLHNQMRILEQVEGDWKIVAVFQIPNRYGYYASPWVRVDGQCRVVDTGSGFFEALDGRCAVRIVGNRLCGHSAADTTALREAVSEADTFVQKRPWRLPVPLMLCDPDGAPMAPCWVTIADMMIVILLHDDRLLGNAIARAGRIFGLTAAQIRVAEAIARGHDLSATAKALQVRPNTVRTHVRRMFERTAVNSQPALVRKLLSVAPPT
jgi:DNA-binding CsgD family transcriptional regulator